MAPLKIFVKIKLSVQIFDKRFDLKFYADLKLKVAIFPIYNIIQQGFIRQIANNVVRVREKNSSRLAWFK